MVVWSFPSAWARPARFSIAGLVWPLFLPVPNAWPAALIEIVPWAFCWSARMMLGWRAKIETAKRSSAIASCRFWSAIFFCIVSVGMEVGISMFAI